MSKPDWKDAPRWARWLAMDKDGDWYWYLNQPNIEYPTDDYWANNGKYLKAGHTPSNWQETLEERP